MRALHLTKPMISTASILTTGVVVSGLSIGAIFGTIAQTSPDTAFVTPAQDQYLQAIDTILIERQQPEARLWLEKTKPVHYLSYGQKVCTLYTRGFTQESIEEAQRLTLPHYEGLSGKFRLARLQASEAANTAAKLYLCPQFNK